jgi:hypothetical protein
MYNYDPRLLWFVAGGIVLIYVFGFLLLHVKAGKKFEDRKNGSEKKTEEKPVVGEAEILPVE